MARLVWLEETLRAKYKGLWVKVTKDVFIRLLVIDDAQKIFECLRTDCKFIGNFDLEEYFGNTSHWKIIVFCDEYQSLPFLLSYNSEKKIISRYGTYIFDMKRLKERIPSKDDYEFLSSKKVTIIGCGAGGSKDAEYLVKSGVGKIVLIDDDILQTENILRHSCQLDDLSIEKIYAVEDKLRKINPYIDVSTSRKNLDVIDSNTNKLIHDSDLIIVATAANEALFNEYAFSHGIPAIYSKVYPMGFGGEIIRVIPGVTPCFDCSHHFKEFIIQETMPEAEFPEYGTISYDSLSDGTPVPIPALAVDSDFISLIGVKMALDVLIEKDPKSLVNSSHIRLWGNKKEWIFNQPYQCISIENDSVKSIKNCIICHGNSVIEKELDKTSDQIDNEYNKILSQIKSTAHEEKNGNN
ncbi:MAG: ThiF family adenylyltransferase [Deltaproteobacteria bacterium]|nr:ThiF family adenylyltransferase [Deltaproteobacteria bacterium]